MEIYGYFEVGGVGYRCTRINAIDQFHMMRRLAPIISSLGSMDPASMITSSQENPQEAVLDTISNEEFLKSIAGIDNKDYDFIFSKCLSSVSRKVAEGSYSPILTQNGGFMYEDLTYDLYLLGSIVWNVVKFNFSNFFKELLPSSPKPSPTSTAPN